MIVLTIMNSKSNGYSVSLAQFRKKTTWLGENEQHHRCRRHLRVMSRSEMIHRTGDSGWNDELRNRIRQVEAHHVAMPPSALSPQESITHILDALRHNDHPLADTGASMLLKMSTDRFKLQLRWMVGTASASALSGVFRNPSSQFHLLMCDYEHSFPSDAYFIDEDRVFLEVQLDSCTAAGQAWSGMLAKLGWELKRAPDGRWLTDFVIWHDFRDEFRPGIGQEEWPRICG